MGFPLETGCAGISPITVDDNFRVEMQSSVEVRAR